jgi:hypothetical protein
VAAAVGAAVAASTVRPRAARALVEVAAVTLAVSLVALAIGVGVTDLLVDVPADTLARMVTVMGLLGVRNLLAATDAPETRALVSRIAVPLLVPACSLTAVALWAWLGWPASGPTQWAVVVPWPWCWPASVVWWLPGGCAGSPPPTTTAPTRSPEPSPTALTAAPTAPTDRSADGVRVPHP